LHTIVCPVNNQIWETIFEGSLYQLNDAYIVIDDENRFC